jgi:hypothetical protein
MKTNLIAAAVSMVFASAMLSIASPVYAEGLTRAQVQQQCADYKKTHVWTEHAGWQLKPGVKAPAESAKTQAQVVAEAVAFLRTHLWDETKSAFVAISGPPRDVGSMTSAQVAKETTEYLRTHVYDEATSGFIPCKP